MKLVIRQKDKKCLVEQQRGHINVPNVQVVLINKGTKRQNGTLTKRPQETVESTLMEVVLILQEDVMLNMMNIGMMAVILGLRSTNQRTNQEI